MGSVYKARHLELGKLVAVKTLDPALVSDAEFQERFKREAKILASLSNPHISMFFSYGMLSTGMPYIAMEFVEGISLASLLEENEKGLAPERALKIALQISSALDYAHKAGVVHRDLKPSNIVLTSAEGVDFVKLLDFGLARLETADEQQRLTRTGELIGTPEYLSPEQCYGRRADERSDIYSFGCLVFALLNGRPPFQGESAIALISQHVNKLPEFDEQIAENLPAGLEQAVIKTLQKEQTDRYQTVAEFAADLELAQKALHSSATLSPNDSAKRFFSKRKSKKDTTLVIQILAGSGLFLLILCGAIYFYQGQKTSGESIGSLERKLDVATEKENNQLEVKELADRLEEKIRLTEGGLAERAHSFLLIAQKFQKNGKTDTANLFAQMTILELLSKRAASKTKGYGYEWSARVIPRHKMREAQAQGGVKTDQKAEEETKALKTENEKKMEDFAGASNILLENDFKGDRHFWQTIRGGRDREPLYNEDLSFAKIFIKASLSGHNQDMSFLDRSLRQRDRAFLKNKNFVEFESHIPETAKLFKMANGNDTCAVAWHYFELSRDYRLEKSQALKIFEIAKTFVPKNTSETINRTRMYHSATMASRELGFDEAASMYTRKAFESLHPEYSIVETLWVMNLLADTQLIDHQYRQAEKTAQKAFAICQENIPPVNTVRLEAVSLRARALALQGKIGQAEKLIENEIFYQENCTPPVDNLAVPILEFVETFYDLGQHDKAMKLLRKLEQACDTIYTGRFRQVADFAILKYFIEFSMNDKPLDTDLAMKYSLRIQSLSVEDRMQLIAARSDMLAKWCAVLKKHGATKVCDTIEESVFTTTLETLASKEPDKTVLRHAVEFFDEIGMKAKANALKTQSAKIARSSWKN